MRDGDLDTLTGRAATFGLYTWPLHARSGRSGHEARERSGWLRAPRRFGWGPCSGALAEHAAPQARSLFQESLGWPHAPSCVPYRRSSSIVFAVPVAPTPPRPGLLARSLSAGGEQLFAADDVAAAAPLTPSKALSLARHGGQLQKIRRHRIRRRCRRGGPWES